MTMISKAMIRKAIHPTTTSTTATNPSAIHLEGGYEIGTCAQGFGTAAKNFVLWKIYTKPRDGRDEEFFEQIVKSDNLSDILTAYAQQRAMDELEAGAFKSVGEIDDYIDRIRLNLLSTKQDVRCGFQTSGEIEDKVFYNPRHEI